jgi:hypothetical protein
MSKCVETLKAFFRPTKYLTSIWIWCLWIRKLLTLKFVQRKKTGSFPKHLNILEVPGTLDCIRLDYVHYRFRYCERRDCSLHYIWKKKLLHCLPSFLKIFLFLIYCCFFIQFSLYCNVRVYFMTICNGNKIFIPSKHIVLV